jgi:GH18 family chitinase
MGSSLDYPNVADWVLRTEGYQPGEKVKYKGNIFHANFWASEPGVGDADHNGWRFHDEMYDQTPHAYTEQAKIIAYIPAWRKKEGFNYANDEMYRYITHGIISFLMFSETSLGTFDAGSLKDVNEIISDVVNAGHRNGTRISIALGGASDYGFLNLMTSVGNDPSNPLIDQVVRNVVDFVKLNNLDGVDLDLECWWGKAGDKDQGGRLTSDGPHPAGHALTVFARKLREAMPDKLVSAAVFGTSWYGNCYDPKLADYVDWLGVMTYDLTGSWNDCPVGPHTALFKVRDQESYTAEQQGEWRGGGAVNNPILSVEDTLWYWTNPYFVNWQGAGQKIRRNKIAAGVPIYGYDFAYGKDADDLTGEVAPGYKSIRYKDILVEFPEAHAAVMGNIKVSGSAPRPPFISNPGNYPYARNIYFETPRTAVIKLNFLRNVGAQGVIIWELSNDVWDEGKSIIKALYESSGNPAKPDLSNSSGDMYLRLTEQDTQLFTLSIFVRDSQEFDEKTIKDRIFTRVLKPAATLAHFLGYGWCGGCVGTDPGYVGEGFLPIAEADLPPGMPKGTIGRKSIYTDRCNGYMAEDRLRIYLSDWTFKFVGADIAQEPLYINPKALLKSEDGAKLINMSDKEITQKLTQTRSSSTTVATYDLTTNKWEVSGEMSIKAITPAAWLLGGVEFTFKAGIKGGQDHQTGVITTVNDTSTLTQSVEDVKVPPHSFVGCELNSIGTKAKGGCTLKVEVTFSLQFDGFLRWGEGDTPKSNYHKVHHGSEARPTVSTKFGSEILSFIKDLDSQMTIPDSTDWDWKGLMRDHKSDLEWALYQLRSEDYRTAEMRFMLDVVSGTHLEIKVHNPEPLPPSS